MRSVSWHGPLLVALVVAGVACPTKEMDLSIEIQGNGIVRYLEYGDVDQSTCDEDCHVSTSEHVSLEAVPDLGWRFEQWVGTNAGGCSGTELQTTFAADDEEQPATCRAVFAEEFDDDVTLEIVVEDDGDSEGRVTSLDGLIDCGGFEGDDCVATYATGTTVTLTATTQDTFAGWEEACAPFAQTATCTLTLTGTAVAKATFTSLVYSVVDLGVGGNAVIVVRSDGSYVAAGANDVGNAALGTGVTATATPTVAATGGIGRVFTTDNHGVMLGVDGSRAATDVYVFGDNGSGQLGLGDDVDRFVPTALTGVSAIDAATSGDATCLVLSDGTVKCAGANNSGELGTATSASNTFVAVEGITGATDIAAGSSTVCVVHDGGKVSCWGNNAWGTLGNDLAEEDPPVATGITDAVQIAMGTSTACVVRSGGEVSCWGYNADGNCGDGTTADMKPVPVAVTGLPDDAVEVALGRFSSHALLANGEVWSWGANLYGEFGNGTSDGSANPVKASFPGTVTDIAAGGVNLCGVVDGDVYCAGGNRSGQMGLGADDEDDHPTPTLFPL